MNSGNRISWARYSFNFFLLSRLLCALRWDLINLFTFVALMRTMIIRLYTLIKHAQFPCELPMTETPMIIVNFQFNFYKQTEFQRTNAKHWKILSCGFGCWSVLIAGGPRASTQFDLIIIVRSHQFKAYLLRTKSANTLHGMGNGPNNG